ncbi:hypothetical protein TNCV_4728241 [Trichonephila clavipes]|nr:hypothetical protein TNCV_4728241 [Trichonephila clavipes]
MLCHTSDSERSTWTSNRKLCLQAHVKSLRMVYLTVNYSRPRVWGIQSRLPQGTGGSVSTQTIRNTFHETVTRTDTYNRGTIDH